jgi:hypothetical protein
MKCSKFKHSGSDTKDGTRRYKGPHRALRCEVLDSSSKLEPPTDFSVLWWVATGPHELATATTILSHFCNQKDLQARLEQLKLSKTDPSTWPYHRQPTPSMQGFRGKLYTNAKPALRASPYLQFFALIKHLEERYTLL